RAHAALHRSDELGGLPPRELRRSRRPDGRVSPDASPVEAVTSRYDWGVDHVGATEVLAATTDTGRHTTGTTEFSLAIAPQNFGVMLRRKLDTSFPDQTADVWIAPDDGGDCSTFAHAGTWYTPGSNTCVFSNPPGETDPFEPLIQTVDRRWRDDEFLVARALTDGHSRIRVRLVFSAANLPLTPGAPLAPQAWSEFRYTAYSWALPPAP
ncbi:MAG TPA: hypothetical protein VLM85_04835, partial [Polyangiaceae bacterium]|nr:hypothetical protein [Polyangiaceae bacterium]